MIDGATPVEWLLWIGTCCSLVGGAALALWVSRMDAPTP
jgi:hypothetical protein